jgi:NAD(P)-dependent dehydrogenase (short-subunit alcohol dehydrogenase family)
MPEKAHWLSGRVAVVTGASRGIGRATAEAMANAGAHVVLAARDRGALEAVCGHIRQAHGEATPVPADVRRAEEVESLFATAEGIGPPTALVCAAGILTRVPFENTTRQIWDETLAVNLTGAFLCCRAAFALMRRAGGGRIVNIASLSGIYATEKFSGLAAYTVSKHGLVGLTEAIAVEGRPYGIRAVCLSPGAVDTEMLRQANPDLRAGLTPAELGELIAALLDNPWGPVSGANIAIFSNA